MMLSPSTATVPSEMEVFEASSWFVGRLLAVMTAFGENLHRAAGQEGTDYQPDR